MSWEDILKNEMNVKTLEEIANELDNAVKMHTSQAKRIRELIAKYNSSLSRVEAASSKWKDASDNSAVWMNEYIRPKTGGDKSFIARAKKNLDEEKRNR